MQGKRTLRRHWLLPVLVALGSAPLIFSARQTLADPPTTEVVGHVVGIDADDLIIDLGIKQGISATTQLELWRPISLKHPVTGKIVSDRFLVGALSISQAREVLSLARVRGTPTRAPRPGDVVIFRRAIPAPSPSTSSSPSTSTSPSSSPSVATSSVVPEDPESADLAALFDSLRGTSLEDRAAAYERWANEHPASRFRRVLREEATGLRKLGEYLRAGRSSPTVRSPGELVSYQAPKSVGAGVPLTIGVEVRGTIAGAIVQLRNKSGDTYSPYAMVNEGHGFWRATLPGPVVRAPRIEVFVETIDSGGNSHDLLGSATEPQPIGVTDVPTPMPASKHDNEFSLWSDYAIYGGKGGQVTNPNDYAWQTEGQFSLRFGDTGLRALRAGFGVIKGLGGSLHDLDTLGVNGRTIGLTYGFLESEIGITQFWGLIGRAIVGLGQDNVTGGAQLFLRFGNDRTTNLLIGGEVLGGIGLRGVAQVELKVIPRVPILLRTDVTNQPAGSLVGTPGPGESTGGGDVGVRGIAEAGYQFTPAFAAFGRVSVQGRTINHTGPGFGLGVRVAW